MKAKTKPPRGPNPGELRKLPGGRVAEFVVEDVDGQKTGHFRVVDTLGLMLRNKTIDVPMHDAGRAFSADFALAGLEGHKARQADPSGVSGAAGASMTERAALAHKRVGESIEAVGGLDRPGGMILWDVLGLGLSVNEWAAGHRCDPKLARGILIACLSVLARTYRYTEPPFERDGRKKRLHFSR